MLHFSQVFNKPRCSDSQPYFGTEEPSTPNMNAGILPNVSAQHPEIKKPEDSQNQLLEKTLSPLKTLLARAKQFPQRFKKTASDPLMAQKSTAQKSDSNLQVAEVKNSTSEGPLEPPALFEEMFVSPTTRAFWHKKPPKFTITPEEIRLSPSAEKQALIDQEVLNAPWEESLFVPFPEEEEE